MARASTASGLRLFDQQKRFGAWTLSWASISSHFHLFARCKPNYARVVPPELDLGFCGCNHGCAAYTG
jgi:hypothetical protein